MSSIRVRRAGWFDRPSFGPNRKYHAAAAWTVWEYDDAGGRDRLSYMVVRGPVNAPFLTVIDSRGQMVTSWHTGITPGDLARRIVPRDAA